MLLALTNSNDMLAESAAEVNTGVINADSVFGSLASIGCDWDAVVVAHMDEVGIDRVDRCPREGCVTS